MTTESTPQSGTDECLHLASAGKGVQAGHGLKKKELLDMVFYIYVPNAAGLENTRCSTWMAPIIDGVEARKLIGMPIGCFGSPSFTLFLA